MKKNIFLFFMFTFILTIISTLISDLSMDSIWNFGFSYNISKGLIPYIDFNMVVGPFYNLLIALFLKLFGNYMIVFQVANSAIISIVLVFVYKKIRLNTLFLILFLFFLPIIYSYNTFCAFLLIGILMLEDSNLKYKNIIIGLLIGIIIMTKHNIGLLAALVGFVISKDKLKLVVGIIIPVIITTLYLIYNNSFLSYIDFCYLGIGKFLDNFYFYVPIALFEIIIVIWMIRKYCLKRDNKILYLLAFQFMVIPVFDGNHVLIGMLPVLYYYLLNYENRFFHFFWKEILFIGSLVYIFFSFPINYLDSSFIKYVSLPNGVDKYILSMSEYVKLKSVDNKVYLLCGEAYLIRMYLGQNPSFYDLINSGNLGSNEQSYLGEINNFCQKENCLFILEPALRAKKNQINDLFLDYVIDNFNYLETLPTGNEVYVNYEINPES